MGCYFAVLLVCVWNSTSRYKWLKFAQFSFRKCSFSAAKLRFSCLTWANFSTFSLANQKSKHTRKQSKMSLQLQTIGIVVADMGKALNFYRTLGFPIPEGLDQEDNVDYTTPNGITLGFLTLSLAQEADPNFQIPVGQSMNLQFMVDTPAAVDEVYQKLMAGGYESYAEPWDAFWGQRFARVKDPDNRIVNIYAHL